MTADQHQSTREKLIKAQNGDLAAREALVSENIALVKYIVKRFLNRGVEYEDLFQYGCLGLLKAIDRFDPDYEVRFSTYAVPVIMGEIRRFLRDDGLLHVSRTVRDRGRRVVEYIQAYRQENERDPDVSQIARALNLESGDVLLALNSRRPIHSLSETVGEDGSLRLMDVLGQDCMESVDRRLFLSRLLAGLSQEERALIVKRYFKAQTQTSIAREMGVSQVQVSRMESRIISRLRTMAEN